MNIVWWFILLILCFYLSVKGMKWVENDKKKFIDSLLEDGSIFIVGEFLFTDSTLDYKSVARLNAISQTESWTVRADSEISFDQYVTLNDFILKFPILKNELVELDTVTDKTFAQISEKYQDLLKNEARDNLLKKTNSEKE